MKMRRAHAHQHLCDLKVRTWGKTSVTHEGAVVMALPGHVVRIPRDAPIRVTDERICKTEGYKTLEKVSSS